jgi:uncharacterized protein YkwD
MRHLSGLLTVLVVLPLLAVGLAAAPASARTASNFQTGIHRLTNEVREQHDEDKLAKRKCVKRFAKKQARRMARQERMFHQDLTPILKKCDLSGVGENVAYGFTAPQGVLDAWMDSEGHRKNILDGSFTMLGGGAKQSEDGTWYLAQVFGRK